MEMLRLRRRQNVKEKTTLDCINDAEYCLITPSWKGAPCGAVKVRRLSDIQVQSIGNFSLIETEEYKWSRAPEKKIRWSEILNYTELNVKICKAALVSPTYDEIFSIIGNSGFNLEIKTQIEHINKQIEKLPNGPARQECETRRDALILAWEIILPSDFMAEVIDAALGIGKSDIKKVTEEILYNAAILAERGHKAPHEYITGVFSDYNKRDIDTRAWVIYEEKMRELREQRTIR
jgi:hypothetical protein